MKKLIPAPKSRRRKMAARLAKKFTQSPPETFGAKAPIELHTVDNYPMEGKDFPLWANWILFFIVMMSIVISIVAFFL